MRGAPLWHDLTGLALGLLTGKRGKVRRGGVGWVEGAVAAAAAAAASGFAHAVPSEADKMKWLDSTEALFVCVHYLTQPSPPPPPPPSPTPLPSLAPSLPPLSLQPEAHCAVYLMADDFPFACRLHSPRRAPGPRREEGRREGGVHPSPPPRPN